MKLKKPPLFMCQKRGSFVYSWKGGSEEGTCPGGTVKRECLGKL